MKWIGLLVGVAICAYAVVVTVSWSIKRFRRIRRYEVVQRAAKGLRPLCGYDLTGNASGICPECGKRIEDAQAIAARAKAQLKVPDDNVWWT